MRPAILAASLALAAPFPASAWNGTSDQQWRSGWGQGVSEAQVTKGSGNEIYVTCTEYAEDIASTQVSFSLAGSPPPPGSEVIMVFDNSRPVAYGVDNTGAVSSACRACVDDFVGLIDRLKSHKSVYVRFADGREADFTLKGSSAAIGDCSPDFGK